ncbi:MAG: hypothetical protein GXO98_03690 [Nitrospirae bacterium]|nr:hypothetical protein [Nitrospirota bacterium]
MKRKILVSGILLILVIAISGCRLKSSTKANTPLTGAERERLLSSTKCACGACNETLATCSCPQAEKQKKELGL